MTISKRKCGRCKRVLATSSFDNNIHIAGGLTTWCKTCRSEYRQDNKLQNPEAQLNGRDCGMCLTPVRGRADRQYCSDPCRSKASSLRTLYGMTPAQYRLLVEDAAGICPICERNMFSPQLDHAHKTGLATGIVCTKCNIGVLAASFHNIAYVKSLLAYLENPPCTRLGIVAIAPEGSTKPSTIHRMWDRKRKAA